MYPIFRLLLSLPSSSALIFSLSYRLGPVPVTNTLVTSVQQLVVWDLVLFDVFLHLLERPICQGVDFNQTGIVYFDNSEIAPFATLTPPSTRQNGVDL